MLDGNTDDRPTLGEAYLGAVVTSDLSANEHRHGAAYLLIAAAVAGRPQEGEVVNALRPNMRLGHALMRLQSEWHAAEKPPRHQAKTIKQWIGLLPLIEVGEKLVEGRKAPIMGRDKEGARQAQLAERERLESLYAQELKHLAQRLPSRFQIREELFNVAISWGWDDAETKVSQILHHWLDANCETCHGTGKVPVADTHKTCETCHGEGKSPMPCGQQGHDLTKFLDDSKGLHMGRFKAQVRALRKA